MAGGVACIIFDFCKREKKRRDEAEIKTFQVNLSLVCHASAPTMHSWSLSSAQDNHAVSLCRDPISTNQWVPLKFICEEEVDNVPPGKDFSCYHLLVFSLVSFAHYQFRKTYTYLIKITEICSDVVILRFISMFFFPLSKFKTDIECYY